MANCYGGVILLGIVEREDGSFETTGLKNVDNLHREFWNLINNPQKVSVNLLTDKDVILAIYVPRAKREDKPVYIYDNMFKSTFRRDGEGDHHCTRSEVKAMLRDQTEETMDMKILENMEISDLSLRTVHAYRNRHAAFHGEHVWEALKDEEYPEHIGAARRTKPNGMYFQSHFI